LWPLTAGIPSSLPETVSAMEDALNARRISCSSIFL
jgi:hypothetical protein